MSHLTQNLALGNLHDKVLYALMKLSEELSRYRQFSWSNERSGHFVLTGTC
ncbi:hypothetical protein FHS14_005729 [Paenibacillus baekrokdamisoli]|nr:hypothetical protein [Paenibacillus baekrokdamisoli]